MTLVDMPQEGASPVSAPQEGISPSSYSKKDATALQSAGVIPLRIFTMLAKYSVPDLQVAHVWSSLGYGRRSSVDLLGQVGSVHGCNFPAYSVRNVSSSASVTGLFLTMSGLYTTA